MTLPRELVRIATTVMSCIGGPVADQVRKLIKEGDWVGLAQLRVDPRSYTDALSYYKAAAAVGFLKKFEQLPGDIDKRGAALKTWYDCERQCYRTNQRLAWYHPENSLFLGPTEPRIAEFIRKVQRTIVSWIGHRPPLLVEGRFGPGATVSDPVPKTTHIHKMSSDPSLTSSAIWFLPQWLDTKWGGLAAQTGKLSFVRGNRFTTVAKTALTDRAISIEPSINAFYQLGLGRVLRRRLYLNTGMDLRRAKEIHMQLARESSMSQDFDTLDLSSASDTVAKELVRLLFPHDWYDCLNDLRSKVTEIDGKSHVLEKFSSMGNGFTFEVETIIFAALACVTAQECGLPGVLTKDVWVLGDDIIVGKQCSSALTSVLGFFGFSLNREKSYFGSDRFRESCGGDYYDGLDVRPIFLKRSLNDPKNYIVLANQIQTLIERFAALGHIIDRKCWFCVLDNLPTKLRSLRGPKGLGDQVIWDEDESKWHVRIEDGIRYIQCLQYAPEIKALVKYKRIHPDIVLACATYGSGGGEIGGLFPRDPPLSFSVEWVAYS